MTDLPIVCDLTALTDTQRDGMISQAKILFNQVAQVKALPTGYGFKFRNVDFDKLVQIAEFVALDRLCCTFIHHQISLPAGSFDLWLYLTSTQDIKAYLETDLSQLLGQNADLITMFKQATKANL